MITLFSGDRFLVERAVKKRLEERLPPSVRDFNFDAFEGREAAAASIIASARGLPVLAPERIVLVHAADELKKGELDQLEGELAAIPKTTELILTASKIDRRLNFWKKVLELAKHQEYRPLYPREVPGWVGQEARLIGKKISAEAASYLVQVVGAEAGLLAAALEKVALYMGGRGEMTVEDVTACLSGFSWKSVFDLTEAAGERNLGRALKLLNGMIAEGESPVALVALLARHFRILLKLKEKGTDRSVPPYFLQDYLRQAGRYTSKELTQALERIFQTDWDLKRSPIPNGLIMEKLLWGICEID